jgi:hypothetical protein
MVVVMTTRTIESMVAGRSTCTKVYSWVGVINLEVLHVIISSSFHPNISYTSYNNKNKQVALMMKVCLSFSYKRIEAHKISQ